jgi:IS30 family transposase
MPLPPGPRHTWQMDFITGLGPGGGRSYNILTLIDTFSKFCVLTLTQDRKSATVAHHLQNRLFSYFGIPHVLQCDNGNEFKGSVAQLCAAKSVKIQRSLPYSSHVQGKVERLHRTLETLLARTMTTLPADAWPTLVPEV